MKILATLLLALLAPLACAAGTGTAKLTWTAPTAYTDGTAIAAGTAITYSIYQGTSASSLVKVKSGITGLGYTIGALDNYSTVYYFAVTASTTTGESAKSATVSKTMPAPPAPKPNPPTGMKAS